MRHKIFSLLFIVVTIFSISMCTDEPTSVGNSIIPDRDKIDFKKIDSYHNSFNQTSSMFQGDSLYYGGSTRILLGAYENVSIDMMVGFGIILSDSIKKGFGNNEILLQTSWIEMKPNYWLGDSSQFNFSVKKINTSWSTSKFTADTLNKIKSSLSEEVLLQNSYTLTDSVITFKINDEVVKEWITNVSGNKLFKNSLYFSPVSANSIAGFQALARYPETDYVTLYMVFEKQGAYVDTIKAFPSIDIHVVTSTLPQAENNKITLQSASKVRGKLWFDVSGLPSNAILNKATLDLFVDQQNSAIGTVKTDSVVVSFAEDKTGEKKKQISALFNKTNFYSGDVRGFVQEWINGEENNGFELKLSDEDRTANKIVFYGSNYNVDSLKPRLTILYTTAK